MQTQQTKSTTIKSLIAAVTLLASTAFAAGKYEAGTICHSNIECEKNCIDKQYTVAEQDGGFVFACDPSVADPTQWYKFYCGDFEGVKVELTEAACKKFEGQMCANQCVLSGKRGKDEVNREKWKKECGSYFSSIDVAVGEEQAKWRCT